MRKDALVLLVSPVLAVVVLAAAPAPSGAG
jgi:hypothetical protein